MEEHQFIATSLKMGFHIDDLKQLQYKDIAKIMLCLIENDKQKNNVKKATQKDIDNFLK